MPRRRRSLLPWAAAALLPALALTAGAPGPARLARETSLRAEPDGALTAFLPAGAAVEAVEERAGWTRVRLEGWIPSAALDATAAAGGTAPDPAAGSAAPAVEAAAGAAQATPPGQVAATGRVEGIVAVKRGAFRKKAGRDIPVYLWPGEPEAALLAEDPESAARLAELSARADELERQADQAMKQGSFTVATQEHDRLMAKRAVVLSEALDLAASRHGRHEAEARRRATATAVTDRRGWFITPALPPGVYTLYARLPGDDFDLEWIEEVRVTAGDVRVDLDRDNARGPGAD